MNLFGRQFAKVAAEHNELGARLLRRALKQVPNAIDANRRAGPGLRKSAASLDAIRKKQYWQLLKRMYGGAVNAIREIRMRGDNGIYHGTRMAQNAARIRHEGLRQHKAINGTGVFFAPKSFVERSYGRNGHLFRLKKPSELTGTKHRYPRVGKAMVYESENGAFPLPWGRDEYRRRQSERQRDRAFTKLKYFGTHPEWLQRFQQNRAVRPEFLYKSKIRPHLITQVER